MASDRPWNEVIRDKINTCMCTRFVENEDRSFITADELESIWTKDYQAKTGIDFNENSRPFHAYIKVISILVTIEFKPWNLAREIVVSGFKDTNLPYQFDDLSSKWFEPVSDKALAKNFVAQQYAFIPVVIEQGRDLKHPDRHLRLPFLSEKLVGEGSFGAVFKVKIAKGYLKETAEGVDSYNASPKIVARKRFRVASYGAIEQDALDRLRKDKWKNDCIISSLASVRLGTSMSSSLQYEYNLFFKFAPADLLRFLHGDEYSYEKLRVRPEEVTPRALFEELFNLVDAIRYLHREELRMCHSDLKPDNVLIFVSDKPEDHPVGQWKLTDFGVASIESKATERAQSVRDVIKSAARMSLPSATDISNEDKRVPGPFHPPEVEDPDLIPEGERYRAKGDVWSLGCITVYVLAYAVGGASRVKHLENIMHATSRQPGRGGYFYEDDPDGSFSLFKGVIEFIEDSQRQWDEWAQDPPPGNTWVQDVSTHLIMPMLNVSVSERATAQSLYDKRGLVQHYIPPKNYCAGVQSPMDVQTSSNTPSQPSTTTPARTISSDTPSSILPSPTRSIRPMPPQPPEIREPAYKKYKLFKNSKIVRISENGFRVVAMTKSGIKSIIRDHDSQFDWRLENDIKDVSSQEWTSVSVSGMYLLLRYKVLTRSGEARIYLHNFDSATQDHQREWNSGDVPNLPSASHTTMSSRGHIAFRFVMTKTLAVYDCRAELLFQWSLARPSVSLQPGQRRRSSVNEGGNFEAVAFDSSGKYLVATAWNQWFLWELMSLNSDGTPSKSGRHSYTPSETGQSKCSLHVLDEGKHFLLHDQCHGEYLICVDTSQSNKIYEFKFADRPKAETIVVSPSCDWLAYLVEGSFPWSKNTLHYCQLQNCTADSTAQPALGPDQKRSLLKIRTKKWNHQSVIDTAISIVIQDGSSFVTLASIAGYVEAVPLQIG